MPLKELFEGEGKLLGVLGTNVFLGGAKVATTAQVIWTSVMPNLSSILTIVQILVASATLVYMTLKIRKIVVTKDSE
jgi:hypothetical protein